MKQSKTLISISPPSPCFHLEFHSYLDVDFLQLGTGQGTRALQRSLKQISSWNEMERSKVSLTFSFSFDFSYKCIKVWIKNGGLWAGQLLGFKRIRFFLRLLWMFKEGCYECIACSWREAQKEDLFVLERKTCKRPEKFEIIFFLAKSLGLYLFFSQKNVRLYGNETSRKDCLTFFCLDAGMHKICAVHTNFAEGQLETDFLRTFICVFRQNQALGEFQRFGKIFTVCLVHSFLPIIVKRAIWMRFPRQI